MSCEISVHQTHVGDNIMGPYGKRRSGRAGAHGLVRLHYEPTTDAQMSSKQRTLNSRCRTHMFVTLHYYITTTMYVLLCIYNTHEKQFTCITKIRHDDLSLDAYINRVQTDNKTLITHLGAP